MTQSTKHIVLFFILALSSYAIYKYYFDPLEIEQDKPFTKGYSIEKLELVITDETGKISAKFKSPNIISYTDNPVIYINTPLFWTYKKGLEQWVLTSKKAEFNFDENEVFLYENVEANTIEADSDTRFSAKDLKVELSTNTASTKNGIKFKKQLLSMSGKEATFDLEKEMLTVTQNIEAIYKASLKK